MNILEVIDDLQKLVDNQEYFEYDDVDSEYDYYFHENCFIRNHLVWFKSYSFIDKLSELIPEEFAQFKQFGFIDFDSNSYLEHYEMNYDAYFIKKRIPKTGEILTGWKIYYEDEELNDLFFAVFVFLKIFKYTLDRYDRVEYKIIAKLLEVVNDVRDYVGKHHNEGEYS